MVNLNVEKLKLYLTDTPNQEQLSSMVFNFITDMGTTDLSQLTDTIGYKFLLGLEILEEVDNTQKSE